MDEGALEETTAAAAAASVSDLLPPQRKLKQNRKYREIQRRPNVSLSHSHQRQALAIRLTCACSLAPTPAAAVLLLVVLGKDTASVQKTTPVAAEHSLLLSVCLFGYTLLIIINRSIGSSFNFRHFTSSPPPPPSLPSSSLTPATSTSVSAQGGLPAVLLFASNVQALEEDLQLLQFFFTLLKKFLIANFSCGSFFLFFFFFGKGQRGRDLRVPR